MTFDTLFQKRIVHGCSQGSDEWHGLRRGKLTASRAQAIGNNKDGLKSLVDEKIREIKTGITAAVPYTYHMARGSALEASARAVYERTTGETVSEIGFVQCHEYIGCSPDGFVGKEGLVEIKCPQDSVYEKYLSDRKINSTYYWQMQMQILVCGRLWCDYVVFNPNYSSHIIIQRVFPNDQKRQRLETGLANGIDLIKKGLVA